MGRRRGGLKGGIAGMACAWALGLGVLSAGLTVTACVGGSKGISSDDKERLKAYVLDAPPADMPHKLDVNFENKVHLVGYKVEPESAKPGQEVKVTMYWRCDEPLEEGWSLFTHTYDDVAQQAGNNDNGGPIREEKGNRQILGPDRWEKGKVYVDEQTYKIPDNVKGPEISYFVGVWNRKGDNPRLHIVSGPNDGENRALVTKIKTGIAPTETKAPEVPSLVVNKLAANDAITIDGKGDDKGWGGAASTGPFVDVSTGKPNTGPVGGSAKLAWDDQNLYVLFDVTDADVTGYFTDAKSQKKDFTVTGQPKTWTKDTVEIMVDPDGNGDNKDYYELQINPQNKVFHSQFDAYNAPKTDPDGPFGHEDWDPKLKSAVVVKGTIDKPGDKDDGYVVEAAIPWAAFSKAANHPPKPGDTWRMNFYAMKNNGGAAWSPIRGRGNFHFAPQFGKITWMVPGQPVAAAAPGDGGAPLAANGDGGAAPTRADVLLPRGAHAMPRPILPRIPDGTKP